MDILPVLARQSTVEIIAIIKSFCFDDPMPNLYCSEETNAPSICDTICVFSCSRVFCAPAALNRCGTPSSYLHTKWFAKSDSIRLSIFGCINTKCVSRRRFYFRFWFSLLVCLQLMTLVNLVYMIIPPLYCCCDCNKFATDLIPTLGVPDTSTGHWNIACVSHSCCPMQAWY